MSSGDKSSVACKLKFDKTTTKVPKDKKNKSHKSILQSSSVSSIGDTSSVACKLDSNKTTSKVPNNKNNKLSKSQPLSSSVDNSSVSSSGDMSSVANKTTKVLITKMSPQLMLCAHQIDWTNSNVTRTEIIKYTNTDHIGETQEAILPVLLNRFKPNDIKTSFAVLISKSNSNTDSYYPLPTAKPKLIESFIKLIFEVKSMMVSSRKKPSM